jgi:hypothetical protein
MLVNPVHGRYVMMGLGLGLALFTVLRSRQSR